MKFSYSDLVRTLRPTEINKLVNYKMNEMGFYKCIELAEKEGIKRQSLSENIAKNPDKFLTIEYGGFLYAKKK